MSRAIVDTPSAGGVAWTCPATWSTRWCFRGAATGRSLAPTGSRNRGRHARRTLQVGRLRGDRPPIQGGSPDRQPQLGGARGTRREAPQGALRARLRRRGADDPLSPGPERSLTPLGLDDLAPSSSDAGSSRRSRTSAPRAPTSASRPGCPTRRGRPTSPSSSSATAPRWRSSMRSTTSQGSA